LNFLDRYSKNPYISNVIKFPRMGDKLFHKERWTDRTNQCTQSLFHQSNAQCYLYVNIKGVSPTWFGTSMPSSERTKCQF
jgi:hypothetical protein